MGRSVPIARRNILVDKRRLSVSVVGVAAAVALILLLEGLWAGFRNQISAYEDNVGADLFVGEEGTENLLGDVSVVPAEAAGVIRAMPGVRRAEAITARFTVLELHGKKQFGFLVGYEPGAMGGPWRLVRGRAVQGDGEVVVDVTLAEQHGLGLGDELRVMGEPLTVVGLSAETRSWMASLLFTTRAAAERFLRAPGRASFILVQTDRAAATAARIEEDLGLEALTGEELAANDRALLARVMEAPLNLMVGIAFAAGTLVVALTVYSAIVERLREYGIAKAMGARWGRLFRIVLGQTLLLTALGTVAGFLVFRGGAWLLAAVRPQMWVALTPGAAAGVVGAAGLMAVLAAGLPTRRVARLDPASVYRG